LNGDELSLLREKALDFGLKLSSRHLKLFSIYLDELIEWNRRMNLTGLSDRGRIIVELLMDSLIPVPLIPEKGMMLDAGSGAGFPGIPLKICRPHQKTVLIEANSKKVSFLKQVIRLLKLDDIRVVEGRIEVQGNGLVEGGYHLVTARAMAPLDKTILWCSPFLSHDGMLICYLGGNAGENIERHRKIMKDCSLLVHKSISYSLPGKRANRTLVIFKKKA